MNIEQIKVSELKPFEAYPFRVQHDEQLEDLSASIALEGVITPLMLRPRRKLFLKMEMRRVNM